MWVRILPYPPKMPKRSIKYEPSDLFDNSVITGPEILIEEQWDNAAASLKIQVGNNAILFDHKDQVKDVVRAAQYLGWYDK